MDAIKTDKLTKYYGKARGITDLNLQVSEGEFFGFIGPNGAGKSTTIRTLLGLIRPTGGSAEIFGQDITTQKNRILSQIGYLPSETTFYSGMKVNEILRLSADLHKTDCSRTAKDLCDRLQLDTTRKAEDLSFGNRKKVGIVCALQHNPRLCILDEPTGGLDPLMQREFFSILKERHEQGMTIFLSSHVLSEIQRYCSRAAIIREGRIIASGSMEELSKTSAKRVTVHGTFDPVDLQGIRALSQAEDTSSFLYQGDINKLLSALSCHPIQDLSIAEPDLEEIFLHYYTDGGENR